MVKIPHTKNEEILSQQVDKLHFTFEEYLALRKSPTIEAQGLWRSGDAMSAWDWLHSDNMSGHWGPALDALLIDLAKR
jgi:hypothetical protein